MLRLKKYFSFTFSFSVILLLTCSTASSGPASSMELFSKQPEQNVTSIAKKGIFSLLDSFPYEVLGNLGFDGVDLSAVYLGKPYRLYKIKIGEISMQAEKGLIEDLSSIVEDTGMWYFPVKVDQQIKAFLVVDKVDGQWEAVSIGYSNLTEKMNRFESKWAASGQYSVGLVVSYQTKEFLVTIPEMGTNNLTSLDHDDDYLTVKDMISTLKDIKTRYLSNMQNVTKMQ